MKNLAVYFLIAVFIGNTLAIPVQKRETSYVREAEEPFYAIELPKRHVVLFDDYGQKPVAPHLQLPEAHRQYPNLQSVGLSERNEPELEDYY